LKLKKIIYFQAYIAYLLFFSVSIGKQMPWQMGEKLAFERIGLEYHVDAHYGGNVLPFKTKVDKNV